MGIFINKGNLDFREALNSEYVDKTGLIAVVNNKLFTRQKFSCVTRCRRFGKSMAAQMLAAYYDESCDSRSLFAGLEIEHDASFEQHLNKYPVLYIELKKDKEAKTGIDQIKERNYPQKVVEYTGDILLVGICYDTDTKEHTCKIERWEKIS